MKWADRNIDAASETEKGGFYSWGETATKSTYSWKTYTHCNGTAATCQDIGSDISRNAQYDRAYASNSTLCLPTTEQWEELFSRCTWTETTVGGMKGYSVKGPSGNSIFLPFSGWTYDGKNYEIGSNAYYWTSNNIAGDPSRAYGASVKSAQKPTLHKLYRRTGVAIRAVENTENTRVIDLGLPSGTRWASCNVGASSPEEYGGYYSWGETEEKDDYSWNSYSYLESYETYETYTRIVCKDIGENICGTKYDVAHVKWGGDWRMPTKAEMEELLELCIKELTVLNDVKVIKFTGPNGNFIYFPLAGFYEDGNKKNEGYCTQCWSGDLDSYFSTWALVIYEEDYNWVGRYGRNEGNTVRPVMTAPVGLTLGTNVLMLTEGETVALTYTYSPANADLSAMKWTTSDPATATVDNEGVVTAVGEGSCTITVSCGSLGQQECRVVVGNVAGTSSGHEYVDLGLPSGTLWATTNVGADTPGETGSLISKPLAEGDAAYTSWGAYWRMPTREQLEELIGGTSLAFTSLDGTDGFLLTSLANDKCIFLPVTNSPLNGSYWSGTPAGGSKAYALNITGSTGDVVTAATSENLAIRPVYDESVAEGSTFAVSAGDLDFGSVAVGNRREISFGIHNNTFGVISVKPFKMDADDFSVDWTGGEIQPNATQTVIVTYSPTKESVAAGGSLLVATTTDSTFVNVAASSHIGSNHLTSKSNLVVWCRDGTKVTFLLNDKPIVTIKGGKWKIDSRTAIAEYAVADVVKMTYDGIPNDIHGIDAGTEKPFAIDAEALTFLSDSENLNVRIVASSGVVVRQFVARRGTLSSVPLRDFAPGVYIVSVNNISYKISIR